MAHELITTVYLNEPASQLAGFGKLAPATLYAAASFTLAVSGPPNAEQIKAELRKVFEQLNIDDPEQPWAIQYQRDVHRAFSVGDVVVIGETAWACAPTGWDLLTADQLHDAIYHH